MIRLAISTCPNDTFAFHGLINRRVDWRGLDFDVQLLDISKLNRGLASGEFDIAKASFHAALIFADRFLVLPSGSALGFGNGPVLLARDEGLDPHDQDLLTLCPGELTTATLLFKLFYGQTQIQHVVFSEIMPRLQAGSSDFGVCIHEGRFTYHETGLHLIEDLGARWEKETSCPLPLGGILGRRSLKESTLRNVQGVIFDSIRYGMENRQETLETMSRYAQEFEEQVLFQHVDLYVNDWTLSLGQEGVRSLAKLNEFASRLFAETFTPLEILDVT